MKKYSMFIILLLIISCLWGCSANKQETDPANTTDPDKIAQENSSTVKAAQENSSPTKAAQEDSSSVKVESGTEKIDIADLNAFQDDSFAYINADGYLVIRNIKDKSEKVIISDGCIYDYDFNYKDNKIAYIVGKGGEDFLNTNAVIYDIDSKRRDVIAANDGINAIDWSPSGKYVALTLVNGPGDGLARIYDVKNKTWLKVPSEKGDGFNVADFKWNPSADILALEMLIYPDPPSPIGNEGESHSISVYFLEKDNSIESIAEGSSVFGYDQFLWIDNETLSIRKNNYNEPKDLEYYKVNIDDGSIVKVPENERDPLIKKVPKEAYSLDRSLSPDGNLLLYSIWTGLVPARDIYLWNIEKQTKEYLCHGWILKWITHSTSGAAGK